jgi:FAD/FMN-containing dehydrogenase
MKRRDFCKATLVGGALSVLPAVATGSFAAESSAPDLADTPGIRLSGESTRIPATAIKELAGHLQGRLITAGDADYDRARRVWNRSFDRRPALIAQCMSAADITRSLAFARERDLLVAVRGGGHSYAGYSSCNGGLVIDLSPMRGVRVDPFAKTARVAGGAWNRDLDWEAQQYGLATPMGRVGNTGVGGLTLGGGYGRLSRLYGLACDNVISADLITADGRLLYVSASENPDLFWAIRGGGGNFGIVSSFEYRLHSVGPQVLEAVLSYTPAQLRAVLEQFNEFCARAPRELQLAVSMNTDENGSRRALFWFFFAGDPQAGERILSSLRAATMPIREERASNNYLQIQSGKNGPAVSDSAEYAKSGHVPTVTPELVEALLQERVDIALSANGGAIADIAPTDSAVAHRREPFQMEISIDWQDLTQSEEKHAEVHAAWDRLKGFTSGFYANLTDADQKDIDDNYGPNRARLMQVKRRYDPDNVFRLNANIRPTSEPL